MSPIDRPCQLVAVSSGTSEPSTTRMMADRASQAVIEHLAQAGHRCAVQVIELAPIAAEVAESLVSGLRTEAVQDAINKLAVADAIIVSAPVYKAGLSGLFKSFVDLLDNDLLIAKPVLLTATAGSTRHAMVVDDHLRPLFAFLRALAAPTSLFAAPNDWGSADLGKRIYRAAGELAALMVSGVGRDIADAGWDGYQHVFGGDATQAQHASPDIDLNTDLMHLARGDVRALHQSQFQHKKG